MTGLSLVIPAHNSAKVIENSLRAYTSAFNEKFRNFEIIVICNDCWDNTSKIVEKLMRELPVRTIEIPQRGKGHALVRGFNEARFDLMGFLDADNPFDLKKIKEMLDYFDRYDVVIASKYVKGKARHQDYLLRRMISLGGGLFSKKILNLNFADTQAGAKFFTKEVWRKISKREFVCKGFDFDMELLYRVGKLNFKIKEYYLPLEKYEKFSTFRLKYLPGMVKRLLILRFLK